MIKVLFFASLRDAAGCDSVNIDAGNVSTIRDLVIELRQQLDLGDLFQDETAMVSIDQCYARWEDDVFDGAEVAFLPPVSGG